MDECPFCGKFTMYYNPQYEEWQCFTCNRKIPEIYEHYNKRLLEQNRVGNYSVEPPRIVVQKNSGEVSE